MTTVEMREAWRGDLRALGFDEVRFVRVDGTIEAGLRDWLAAGMQADMHWIERTVEKRRDPRLVVPGARTIAMLGVNYWSERWRFAGERSGPRWARYALHDDYHETIRVALGRGAERLQARLGPEAGACRYYVDTGPVLERAWAARSGLGFSGKNAMLISREFGNWIFLAAIVTVAEFPPDEPIRKTGAQPGDVGLLCGKCTRCLDACPTDAFAAPGVVDARRCISYQTIENRGIIPRELRAGIGERIYGCDVCLEVCPWNRFAQEGRRMLLNVRGEILDLGLSDLLALTPARFAEVFRRTAIKRVKLGGLLRNACVVAGNSADRSLVPALLRLASHELPVVRAHAVWAVYRLTGKAEAEALLAGVRAGETDAAVKSEYTAEDQGG